MAANMASNNSKVPHFLLFPFAASGHTIPLLDTAIMLAHRGVKITIFTTVPNANRFESFFVRVKQSGLPIQTVLHPFSGQEAGLPAGCESLEMTNTPSELHKFMVASNMSLDIVEKLCQDLSPTPNCVISDICLPYTAKIASKFGIPRITFLAMGCMTLYCMFKARSSGIFQDQTIDTMEIALPSLPVIIEVEKHHIPFCSPPAGSIGHDIVETHSTSYGVLVNSFEELEPAFHEEFKKCRNGKVWCIGPVSVGAKVASNKNEQDSKVNSPVADGQECMKWLDSKGPSSVLYVCLGSLCNLSTEQMIEMGLGLEASNRPFIWVISQKEIFKNLIKWISESEFEERVKGRGLIIKGWAPQVSILSHRSTGGFLTHCGWNSIQEAVSCGMPMICIPLFGGQFCGEKLVVDILKIGVSLGANDVCGWGLGPSVEKMVKIEVFERAINELFEGEESEKRRERAKELQYIANRTVKNGGSSHTNMNSFIEDITQPRSQISPLK